VSRSADAELIAEAFKLWSEGRMEEWARFIDPEIEWDARDDLPDSGVYRGLEGLQELLGRFEEVMEDIWFKPIDLLDVGGRVVVPLEWGGKGKGSGIELGERSGETWVFTVRNGRIAHVKEFTSKEEALAFAESGGEQSG
jgi:ketosteroid isomerase-like protein